MTALRRILLGGLGLATAMAQISVPMSQYNAERTAANLQERVLHPSNVEPKQFGKLFTRKVDDNVYALPLIGAGLNVGGKTRNVLFVATMSNTVYAFDADDPAQSKPLWSRNLSIPAAGSAFIGPTNFGILSTPYLDAASGTLYVVTKDKDFRGNSLSAYALDVQTGKSKFGSPQQLSFPLPGGGAAGIDDAIQRAGLLVAAGTLYIAVADVNNGKSQDGFAIALNAANLRERRGRFQATPTGDRGGIWQAGRGLAADADGNVYLATEGSYNGETDFGNSVMKLASGKLTILDWFTPANVDALYKDNIDLSANGVTLIPNSPLLFAGGKEGVIYLLDRANLGKREGAGGAKPVERFQASRGCGLKDCTQTLGTAFWSRGEEGVLYVWDRGDVLRSFRFAGGRFETEPFAVSSIKPAMTGGPSISANGADPASGIVWALTTDQTADFSIEKATLRAFLASDISQEIYNSGMDLKRDGGLGFVKMSTPVVANGKVYVATPAGGVAVYGLLASGK